MCKPYNGHPSWAAWNVSLWVANHEPLYRMALDYMRDRNARDAARALLTELHERGVIATPDGARYSVSNLAHALRGLQD
jgi:hypothetical protein